jgi:hypothetical protein
MPRRTQGSLDERVTLGGNASSTYLGRAIVVHSFEVVLIQLYFEPAFYVFACHGHGPRRLFDIIMDNRWRRLSDRTVDQSTPPRGNFLDMARLGDLAVGTSIEASTFSVRHPHSAYIQVGVSALSVSYEIVAAR